jgi:protein-tyrosine-phosphatase/DNA-binding transcriptional ArsR family regulator
MVPAFVRLAAHPVRWRLLTELAGSDLRVRELVERVGEPQNLVSYHLRLLRDGGLVTASRSSFDGRDSYYHLHLDACGAALAGAGGELHPALAGARDAPPSGLALPPKPESAFPAGASVLFVCSGNSARSPVAEALLRHRTGGRVTTASAGTKPKPDLHPDAVRVLRVTYGIDISAQRPRGLKTPADRRFSHVISLCDKAREACPEFPHRTRRAHWSIPDPATALHTYPAFEKATADIDTRIRHLLPTL